jgi:RNA polymerase sigma-70 factor, ECF subfamily
MTDVEATAVGTAAPAAQIGEPQDVQLVEEIARGEPHALTTLYDRYRTMAYSLAFRVTGDTSLAEDVVQEAFLGLWRNAGRYSSVRASVRTWLLAIVHHRAIDALRRRRATSQLPDGDAVPPMSLVMPDVWPEVAGRLDREQVRRALEAISQPQREAIALAYYGGLTQQEIATRTGTPLGTVKSRVRLGLLALRHALISQAGERERSAAEQRP